MGLISRWFRGFGTEPIIIDFKDNSFQEIALDISCKEIVLQSAINLIAKSLANSEFVTYKSGKEEKKDNYYLFNIEPNPNQNGTEFWNKVVSKLINDNDALIIQQKDSDGQSYLYLADKFEKDVKTLKEGVFFDVVIGDLEMKKKYSSSDVLYLTMNNQKIKDYIDILLSDYIKLIKVGMEDYKKQNGIKGQLKIGTLISQMFKKDDNNVDVDKMSEWIKTKFKSYFTDVNSVLPLEDGLEFTERQNKNQHISIEETRKGLDGAFDYVAYALNIPKGIIKGDLADIKEQMKNFLTLCVDPIAELISKEINRKYYKKIDFLNGTYLKVDTSRIEHVNIFDVASSLDVLTRISWSRNELNKILGEPEIDEEWANKHYVTKNYTDLKGEKNEK